MAVVGVANKATDYTQTDVLQLSLLTDSVWKLAERKETEEALRRSEERFRCRPEELRHRRRRHRRRPALHLDPQPASGV